MMSMSVDDIQRNKRLSQVRALLADWRELASY